MIRKVYLNGASIASDALLAQISTAEWAEG